MAPVSMVQFKKCCNFTRLYCENIFQDNCTPGSMLQGKTKGKKLKTDRNKTYGLTVASDPDQDRVDFVKIRPIKILRP